MDLVKYKFKAEKEVKQSKVRRSVMQWYTNQEKNMFS